MTMPVMEPDLDAAVLRDWARAIDDGPFASLCWGERVTFDNPDTLTLLGALAAWTDRVRMMTTVVVPQVHGLIMLAKAVMTRAIGPFAHLLGVSTGHPTCRHGLGVGLWR